MTMEELPNWLGPGECCAEDCSDKTKPTERYAISLEMRGFPNDPKPVTIRLDRQFCKTCKDSVSVDLFMTPANQQALDAIYHERGSIFFDPDHSLTRIRHTALGSFARTLVHV